MAKNLVIFTYAPAGLGHIRVADALMEGLNDRLESTVFAPINTSLETQHRYMSINPIARRIMEWVQYGEPQVIFTRNYRNYLKSHADKLIIEYSSLIRTQKNPPEKVIIVSTHFGLAHQIGAIKNRLEKMLGIEIFLVVQVTDDSPLYIWYVENADLITCPSEYTKNELIKYAKREKLKTVNIEVIPYPVLPKFASNLSQKDIKDREDQYNPDKKNDINVVIPVSGAAVGMQFFSHLMEKIHSRSKRFVFHVICRNAVFTNNFINDVMEKPYVRLFVSDDFKQIVHMYNNIYSNCVVSAEITKPSEQAFKALLNPDSIGGSFIFFAKPVGRQEYDNINFLKRHGLLGNGPTHKRGIMLPNGSQVSAELILESYQSGYLLDSFRKFTSVEKTDETGDNGVSIFWKKVFEDFKEN